MIERILAARGRWVKVLAIYFTLFSAVGFTMFVFEEGMQTAMFAAFAYQAVEDWPGLERHLEIMHGVGGLPAGWAQGQPRHVAGGALGYGAAHPGAGLSQGDQEAAEVAR